MFRGHSRPPSCVGSTNKHIAHETCFRLQIHLGNCVGCMFTLRSVRFATGRISCRHSRRGQLSSEPNANTKNTLISSHFCCGNAICVVATHRLRWPMFILRDFPCLYDAGACAFELCANGEHRDERKIQSNSAVGSTVCSACIVRVNMKCGALHAR